MEDADEKTERDDRRERVDGRRQSELVDGLVIGSALVGDERDAHIARGGRHAAHCDCCDQRFHMRRTEMTAEDEVLEAGNDDERDA